MYIFRADCVNDNNVPTNPGLKVLGLLSACSALALVSQSAFAQSTAPQMSASANEPVSDNGEIVVTARKRSESLQDIPLSVSAFGAQQLIAQHSGLWDLMAARAASRAHP